MYIFRLKIHAHRRYVKKPSAGTQVSTGANEKRFINKTYIYRFLKQRSFASSRGTHSKTGKNTMKPLIRILSLWLAALCFGACTDDDLIDGTPTPEPETGIVIRLSAGDLEQTRTELTSQANLQHVETVYALLYKGHYKEGQNDTTELIACDELTGWNPEDEGNGGPHGKEYKLPKTENLPQGNYTVLCIGLDDNDEAPNEVGGSGKTYNLPKAIESKTLSEAKATLAEGKTKDDIAKSELFAGWNQFHFAPDSLNIVEVEMKRRVAGVICYLTDVPYQLTKDDGTWRVQKVILRLFTQQNKSISLLRPEQTVVDNKYVDDFGDASFDTDSNSDILMEFDLSNYGPQENNKELYKIPVATGANQLPNTLLGGVYMIPIDNTTDKNTLQIELWGKKIENDELTGDEARIRSFPAINDDIDLDKNEESGESTPSYTYPIRPNIIYHIGTKPSNDGTTGDTPESLAGTKVNIVAEEWKDQEINVEFPSVSVELRMELMDMDVDKHIYTNLQPQNPEDDYFIFDCIGSREYYQLNVYRSVLYNKWKVQAYVGDVPGAEDRGIYFKQINSLDPDESLRYKDEYIGFGNVQIPIVMTDYAKNDGKETRKITISLVALDDDENAVEDTRKKMVIEQYNAIPVTMENGDVRGFSRFDWNAKRDKNTGAYISAPVINWVEEINGSNPLKNLAAVSLYGYSNLESSGPPVSDGLIAYKGFVETLAKNIYEVSAIYKTAAYSIIGNKDTADINTTSVYWYLPAKNELENFLKMASSDTNKYNIELYENNPEHRYCSSSSNLTNRVYIGYVESTNNYTIDDPMERTGLFRVRQCCHVD